MNRLRVSVALLTLGVLVLGAAPPPPKYLARVTPEEFFSGELGRLKPHIDFEAGCVKLDVRPGYRCVPMFEMYCDGIRVDRASYGARTDEKAGELTWSWRRQVVDGRVRYDLRVGGAVSYWRTIYEPKPKRTYDVQFTPCSISKSIDLTSEADSAIVWAVGAGRGVNPDKQEEIKRLLRTAPWVLVLRLSPAKTE